MIFESIQCEPSFLAEWYKIVTEIILELTFRAPKINSRCCQNNVWVAAATYHKRELIEVRKSYPRHSVG